ncbi:hypothetical protein P255_00710 [Acinetobacter brisouii CIP 110357]|uniref:Alpha/beta hydrolase n=1 Tax=Acinetobacter brisouii CIP 110357 TaxID=1341683 RepID=V2UVA9_9GAMM|nr:hypothetical protein [Acinetobacter brisouii]ENV46568.1 hypothetical protein F954_02550 [Acinetobacter brisouii ANC 4119]ESK52556.1 hypothetical protein P255_00710 [Acinetobacter brisouii CIP 110357]
MKIIFIHGIKQQNFDACSFQEYWLNVFNTGMNKIEPEVNVDQLDLAFPFYGDILDAFNHRKAVNLETLRPNWSFFAKLPRIRQQRSDALKQALEEIPLLPHDDTPYSLKNRFFMLSQLAKDRMLKEMVMLLNHFPDLHESLIQRFLCEVYLYWYNPEFKQQVHERILTCFEPNQRHIVIAHSLGTVIAYNLLHELSAHYEIKRFITLASPLPFNVIQKHLMHPVQRPKVLSGDWHNFYSQDDYLTTFPMLPPMFDLHPQIDNKLITTFVDKPHEITGYLQHPLVIRRILELLYDMPQFQAHAAP